MRRKLLSPLQRHVLIQEAPVAVKLLSFLSVRQVQEAIQTKSVSDRDDHHLLLRNHHLEGAMVVAVVESASVDMVDNRQFISLECLFCRHNVNIEAIYP